MLDVIATLANVLVGFERLALHNASASVLCSGTGENLLFLGYGLFTTGKSMFNLSSQYLSLGFALTLKFGRLWILRMHGASCRLNRQKSITYSYDLTDRRKFLFKFPFPILMKALLKKLLIWRTLLVIIYQHLERAHAASNPCYISITPHRKDKPQMMFRYLIVLVKTVAIYQVRINSSRYAMVNYNRP